MGLLEKVIKKQNKEHADETIRHVSYTNITGKSGLLRKAEIILDEKKDSQDNLKKKT